MRRAVLAALVGCAAGEVAPASSGPTAPVAPVAQPAPVIDAAPPPAHACTYALIAPDLSPIDDVPDLAHVPAAVAATRGAIAALALPAATAVLADDARPTLDDAHWAIVPAVALDPRAHVVTVGGAHPLTAPTAGPLAVAACADPRAPAIEPAKLTTLILTGTTAPTRFVARLMDARGATFPARDVAAELATADFVHVSNEVSFSPTCTRPGALGLELCARESAIALLDALHVSIVELDGSHLIDHGRDTFAHTLDLYDARGWHHFGGGRDQQDGARPLELEHHGNRFALIGCNMPKTTAHAIGAGPDVAACDLDRIAWQIAELRARGVVPIVSIQHEEVYVHDPPDAIVRDFRRLAEAGAAVVFGSQAHVAHPFEVHAGAFVHYGAGNFIFDQQGVLARDGTVDRLALYAGRLLAVEHRYTRIEDQGRPRWLTARERAGFLAVLAAARAKLPRAEPDRAPTPVALGPDRPDSFLDGATQVRLRVTPPTGDARPAALVIFARAPRTPRAPDAAAYTIVPADGATWSAARVAAVRAFALAAYPIDPARISAPR